MKRHITFKLIEENKDFEVHILLNKKIKDYKKWKMTNIFTAGNTNNTRKHKIIPEMIRRENMKNDQIIHR